MDDVVIAGSQSDLQAAEAVEAHHAQLAGTLRLRVHSVIVGADPDRARAELHSWCRAEVVPHALAEEQALYPVASALPEGRLLVEAMLAEHRAIVALVDELAVPGEPRAAAGNASALRALFESHVEKENRQLLPLLLRSPGVSVAALLGDMHEVLGEPRPADPGGGGSEADDRGSACGCHEEDRAVPELDARSVPHAIRHATVFGALEAVRAGGALVLVAPHDPLPLLAQLERREPGAFAVKYLERGPDAWRLRLERRTPDA